MYCDWNPSRPDGVPDVAVTAPHGSNAADPDSAEPFAVKSPTTSVCASV